MAFDAGFLSAILFECEKNLAGARVDKIFQVSNDEIVLLCRTQKENMRLMISASASSPKMGITKIQKENPTTPPPFCMLLRKYLTNSKIISFSQLGFERIAKIEFLCRDEMGYDAKMYLICEIMGKYSNIIFTDESEKILGAIKTVDFTTSSKRQILWGMKYTIAPSQNKKNPIDETREGFFEDFYDGLDAEKFILQKYMGISTAVAREIAYMSQYEHNFDKNRLFDTFSKVMGFIKNKNFVPCIVYDTKNKPLEYCFIPLNHFEKEGNIKLLPDFATLLDTFFAERDRLAYIKQHAGDISQTLNNIKNRLQKKLVLQKNDIKECENAEKYMLFGNLITTQQYMIKGKSDSVTLVNYYSENGESIVVPLDIKLNASQNAAKYFKKYNKMKTAKKILAEQIEQGEAELNYIETLFDSISKIESESDIDEIRREMSENGYLSKAKYALQKKIPTPKLTRFVTERGVEILVGRNNKQNDYLTTKIAEKGDWWFHVKNAPGSHTVMLAADLDEEPDAKDFTIAAEIAAYYSSLKDGENIAVDYTLVRNVKKPAGSKDGFVTYSKNYTAYVNPGLPNEKNDEKV